MKKTVKAGEGIYSFIIAVLFLSSLFFTAVSTAAALNENLKNSYQLVLVKTPNWQAVKGKLQRYQRKRLDAAWIAVGEAVPIVVGKNGMAWEQVASKREGDNRTPVGLYRLGPVFGFSQRPQNIKMAYLPLSATSACVDDQKSHYYNQLLDSSKIASPDWQSAEAMRQVPNYQWGAVIQYNTDETKPGAGSCIFLHSWTSPNIGTAGCVAMDRAALKTLLLWLDPGQKPMMGLLTEPVAKRLQEQWG